MVRSILLLLSLCFLCSCGHKAPTDQSQTIISMQLVDRNGFTETISNKDRLKNFQATNFDSPQPYQKVLRVYGRNLAGQSISKITSYHDNGHIWQSLDVVDGRAHGAYREWYPNAQIKIEAPVIEGSPDINAIAQSTWIFDGLSRVYDEEGNLIAQIPYEKGLLHTDSLYFYSNGRLQKQVPYEKGLTHGTVQVFDSEGILLEETPYVHDEKHGISLGYWNPDEKMFEEEYNLGILLNASYYDNKGNCVALVKDKEGKQASFKEGYLYSLMKIHEGRPEGELQIFHPSGVLYRSLAMLEGKKEGEEWEYYPSQPGDPLRPKISLHWHDDKIQGQVKTWYPNGQIESQREISNNKKQGLCFAWYKSGDLMLIEEYEYDRLVKGSYYKKGDKAAVSKIDSGKGTATLYSSDGILLRKISYDKGLPQLKDELSR